MFSEPVIPFEGTYIFIEKVYLSDKSKLTKRLISQNIEIVKQVGRVNECLDKTDNNKNTIEILVLKEKLSLKFDGEIDISSQKNKISEKIKILSNKINSLKAKLQNKAYLKNAPKNIVDNDKVLLRDLSIEENKLRSIVSSIN